MNFVIKFPTRGRKRFFDVLAKWIGFLSGKHDVLFIVTLDNNDEEMNTPEVREKLDSLAAPRPSVRLQYVFGNSKSKIEAVNADLEGVAGDILIVASDDMTPVEQGYDDIIAEAFRQHFPNLDGAIRFWDGRRKKTDPLMTLAVMGWTLYKAFGYIYHPSYVSIRCDVEQTQVCQILKRLAIDDRCIIRHDWGVCKDEMLKKNNSSALQKQDYQTYNRRRKQSFYISEVSECLRKGVHPIHQK